MSKGKGYSKKQEKSFFDRAQQLMRENNALAPAQAAEQAIVSASDRQIYQQKVTERLKQFKDTGMH